MKKFSVNIYHVSSVANCIIEAENEKEAEDLAKQHLEVGDGRYSDFNESDFKKSDEEYVCKSETTDEDWEIKFCPNCGSKDIKFESEGGSMYHYCYTCKQYFRAYEGGY
jgi:hypothetical protein